jgi:hypothetical protein
MMKSELYRILFGRLVVFHPIKKPSLCGTRKFISVIVKAPVQKNSLLSWKMNIHDFPLSLSVDIFRTPLTPRSRVLLEGTFPRLVKISSAFYGSGRFIAVFKKVCHWSPSRAESNKSASFHPIYKH